jgi:hypothetical protein
MLLLTAAITSKVQVITGSALASTFVHVSSILNGTSISGTGSNFNITTATTTDICVGSASGPTNVKNISITNTNATAQTITVQHTDGTNAVPLWEGVLGQKEKIQYNEIGGWIKYDRNGVPVGATVLTNSSVATQSPAVTDTYITGSNILIPAQRPKVQTIYTCLISITKTASGITTPIFNLRYGTNASTADTSIGTHTFGAGTAAADTGVFMLTAIYRTVGSGTSAVVTSFMTLDSTPSAGLSSTSKSTVATSSGHDSTTNNTSLGISVTPGTSAAWTINQVYTEIKNI